jgi:hypothetical protein
MCVRASGGQGRSSARTTKYHPALLVLASAARLAQFNGKQGGSCPTVFDPNLRCPRNGKRMKALAPEEGGAFRA